MNVFPVQIKFNVACDRYDIILLSLRFSSLCWPFFRGSTHFTAVHVIPIGLPVLFVTGGWMYREGRKVEAGDEEEEDQWISEEYE